MGTSVGSFCMWFTTICERSEWLCGDEVLGYGWRSEVKDTIEWNETANSHSAVQSATAMLSARPCWRRRATLRARAVQRSEASVGCLQDSFRTTVRRPRAMLRRKERTKRRWEENLQLPFGVRGVEAICTACRSTRAGKPSHRRRSASRSGHAPSSSYSNSLFC